MSRADCGWPCEQVGSRSNVWYGAILKGDASAITIAANTSIKDRVVIAPSGAGSVTIGSEVLVGQGACIGNATIKDKAVIGMGSTVGDGAVVESGAYVAPGSIVAAGETVPAGKLFSGSAVLRDLTEEESGRLEAAKEALIQLGAKHAEEAYKGFLEIEQDKSDAKWKFDRTLDSDGALGLLEKNPRAQVW
jgi:carbonic anhydrase/acetyltransferase-like protein (isoleucine patch superfamily)